jgi:hypothetical protein
MLTLCDLLLHSRAFARDSTAMSHAEKRGANDRYLVNPIIRWRGREWRLRVDLTRLTREHLNGRNRRKPDPRSNPVRECQQRAFVSAVRAAGGAPQHGRSMRPAPTG